MNNDNINSPQGTTGEMPITSASLARTPAKQQVVDLFPVLADRKMMALGAMRAPNPNVKAGSQISIFSPMSFEEAVDIVECLRCRAATTISLEHMKKIDASRLVDFVAGASAALDGDFHKLSEQVYIFCPSNIKLTSDLKMQQQTAADGSYDLGALDFLYPSNTNTKPN